MTNIFGKFDDQHAWIKVWTSSQEYMDRCANIGEAPSNELYMAMSSVGVATLMVVLAFKKMNIPEALISSLLSCPMCDPYTERQECENSCPVLKLEEAQNNLCKIYEEVTSSE